LFRVRKKKKGTIKKFILGWGVVDENIGKRGNPNTIMGNSLFEF